MPHHDDTSTRTAAVHALPQPRRARSDGGPLRLPAGAPVTLSEALRHAAGAPIANEIVYVQADGTEVRQTHAALLEAARRVCAGLAARRLRPGDAVLLQIEAGPEFVPVFWGCVLAGIVPVPLAVPSASDRGRSAIHKLRSARHLLGQSKVLTDAVSTTLVHAAASGDDALAGDIMPIESLLGESALEPGFEPTPDSTAVLLLTSGTGGLPKAVPLSHRNVLAYAFGAAQLNGFADMDVSLNWMPLDHVGGLVMFHVRDVVMRCRHVHVPTELILQSPLRWLDLLHHYRATLTWAPNFAFALVNRQAAGMAGRKWDLTCLRFILNGGEAVVGATGRRFLELLAPFGLPATAMHPAWGMSETSSGITYSDRFRCDAGPDADAAVEVGVPIPGVSLRITSEQDDLLAEGETGAVQVRGSPVTRGYIQAQGIDRSPFTHDGWFRTGDLGVLRDGRLTITGREKDILIVNGVNFTSHEIEAVVEAVPGVETSFTAACAVRQPGDQTDRLALFLGTQVTQDGDRRELVHRIRAELADRSGIVADHFVFLAPERIPKTAIGKIRRSELKRQFEQGAFAQEEYRPAQPLGRRIPMAFHRRAWREANRPPPEPLASGPWLVFADVLGLGESLARHLLSQGTSCIVVAPGESFARHASDRFVVDPRHPADYLRLHAALRGEGLAPRWTVHLWAYGPDRMLLGADELTRRQEFVAFSSLYWVQALARSRQDPEPHRLWVVSSRGCEVRQGEGVACEKTVLGGLLKTLAQECRWLTCRNVDFAECDVAQDLAALRGELATGGEYAEVAYRRGQRWHLTLEGVPPASDGTGSPLVVGGCYLVSGGMGGIGSVLVDTLLVQYRAHVLVIGRSPSNSLTDRLQELCRSGGDLTYASTDIADAAGVDTAIREAERRWGRSLDGIFHLAGTYTARPLLEETPVTLARGLRAKVVGAWVLHQSIQQRPGAFIVHFSSVLGAFGGALAGVYAAGNAFLAGLAHAERALGLRSHCLMWSQWSDTGMNRGAGLDAALRGKGYRTLTRSQGLELLWASLREDCPHLLIGLDEKNVHIRPHLATPPDETAVSDRTSPAPRTKIERELARIWREVLEREAVGVSDNFFEIGGDSLMAVRVVAEIEAAFGKNLPMTTLFRAPTVEQLARMLDHEPAPAGSCQLVTLRAAGAGAPFFCIAGAGENAGVFEDLATELPSGRPVCGLHVLALDTTGPGSPRLSIEGVGTSLLDTIRGRQPHGPYHLGGHCLGGLFAYEVAQQLRASNEDVALLVLLDTIVSDGLPMHVAAPLRLRLEEHWRQMSAHSGWGKLHYVVRRLAGRRATVQLRRRLRRALEPIEEMHRRYELKPYPGRLTLVFASDSYLDRDPARDPRRRWERLARDGAEILSVAGDHESLLHPPFVGDLARQLGGCLEAERPAAPAAHASTGHRGAGPTARHGGTRHVGQAQG